MIRKFKHEIDAEMKRFLAEAEKRYKLRGLSGLLSGGIGNFLLRDGKRIRPVLFLLAYEGYTKRRTFPSRGGLLRAALSFELLHDFLLIHDDVIDRSGLRRGEPTLHRLFNRELGRKGGDSLGPALGIVAGDIIFALAVEALLSIDEIPSRKEAALRRFIEAAVYTGAGEFMDVVGGSRDLRGTREKDIMTIYTMKTAKYTFEGPLSAGAVLAGVPAGELKKLSRLGICLGQAFQILDDLLDVFSTTKETGKPSLSDLGESKKTLLAWKAYAGLGRKDKSVFAQTFGEKKKTARDLFTLKHLIEKSGSAAYCADIIRKLADEAAGIIRKLKMRPEYKNAVMELSDKLCFKTR